MAPMDRRTLLGAGLMLPALALSGCAAPTATLPVPAAMAAVPIMPLSKVRREQRGGSRTLVLVELAGGNDGLNTIVPQADELYAKLRPTIGLAKDDTIAVGGGMAFNAALRPLMPVWERGDLAVVLGVGYPRPNLSHFRSIEIWETASDSEEILQEGWLSVAIAAHPALSRGATDADAIVIGDGSLGPVVGNRTRVVTMTEPRNYKLAAARVADIAGRPGSDALAHLVRTQQTTAETARRLSAKISAANRFAKALPTSGLGRKLATVADLMADGIDAPVFKVTLSGFDTHINQRGRQEPLLTQLAAAIAGFRDAAMQIGRWDSTVMLIYSEFGRRVGENESRGTDHGTAGPVFIAGGAISGGFKGRQPRLDDLDDGNLRHNVDFRQVYASVLAEWWGQGDNGLRKRGFTPLDLVA